MHRSIHSYGSGAILGCILENLTRINSFNDELLIILLIMWIPPLSRSPPFSGILSNQFSPCLE